MKRLVALLLCLCLLPLWAVAERSWPDFRDGSLNRGSVNVSGICFKKVDYYGGGHSTTVNGNVSARKIATLVKNGGSYGINYKITISGVREPVTYQAQIIFIAPDGYEYSYQSQLSFSQRTSFNSFDCIGEDLFFYYYMQYGTILSGDYRVQLVLNGMLANESIFTVE